jgi:protein-disulfide isomerase
MLKKIFSVLTVLIAVITLSACSESNEPVEGKQYTTLAGDLSTHKLPPVVEVFSLGCGHCRNLESVLPNIESLIDEKIGKVHVTFNESAQISAMIFYAAVMQSDNGVVPSEMKAKLFDLMQNQELSGADKKSQLDALFLENSMTSPYDLDEHQQKSLFNYMRTAESVSVDAQIDSVPTFIINGKYQVILPGHDNVDDIAKTINYLKNK